MIIYLTTICVYRDYNLSLVGLLYGATPSGQETATTAYKPFGPKMKAYHHT